jgi:hypothetical protein
VRGYVAPFEVSPIYNTGLTLTKKLYTGYTQAVDKILAGVYSYTQAKSYIRVRIVDNYEL